MAETTKLAIVAIVFLIIGLAIGYAIKPAAPAAPTQTVTVTETKTVAAGAGATTVTKTVTVTETAAPTAAAGGLSGEIPIGIALPESGSLATDGKEMINAAKMAIEDFNKFLAEIGAPFKFKPIVADTRTSPQGGREAVETLINVYGCQVIVGTASSMVLKQAMQYAIEKGVPMLSPSSTSPLLAKPDIIYRLVGTDAIQGKALAELIWHEGYRKVAVIFRDEAYGRGIAETFKKYFEEKGGKVEMVPYSPEQIPGPEVVNTLAQKVQALGADKQTAVLIIAFEDDGKAIFKYASQNDILSSVRWFSSESIKSAAIIPPNIPEDIAEWLIKVKFTGTFPVPEKNPLTDEFYKRYKELYGHEPAAFAPYAYDCAYVACLSVVVAGKYDGKVIAKVIPEVCKHFYGVTGWKILDENGDLKYQDYSIWTYVKTPEGYGFKDIGMYHSATNTITITEG